MFIPVNTLTSTAKVVAIRVIRNTCIDFVIYYYLYITTMQEEEKEEKVNVDIGELAYRKIVYHIIRYPTSKVTGMFIDIQEFQLANKI